MTTLEIYAVDAAGKQKKIKAEALRVVLPDGAELQILPDAEGLLIATPAEDFDPARLVLKPGAANAVRVAVERDGEAITELPEFNEIRDGELDLAVQYVDKPKGTPTKKLLKHWVKAALEAGVDASITLRIVDEDEGRALNRDYRGKDYATNVLSFAFNEGEPVPGMEGVVMGDLVLCAPVVAREAADQDKELEAHWAHLVIHGVLHLQAYDHLDDVEAEAMEALETAILQSLGYPDPYLAERDGAIDA